MKEGRWFTYELTVALDLSGAARFPYAVNQMTQVALILTIVAFVKTLPRVR